MANNLDEVDRILSSDNITYTGREVRERLEAAGFMIVPKRREMVVGYPPGDDPRQEGE